MKNVILSLVGLLMFVGCEGDSMTGYENVDEPLGYVCTYVNENGFMDVYETEEECLENCSETCGVMY